jgi:hypothetical protein
MLVVGHGHSKPHRRAICNLAAARREGSSTPNRLYGGGVIYLLTSKTEIMLLHRHG